MNETTPNETIHKVQTITVKRLPDGYHVEVDDGRPVEVAKDDVWLQKILAPKGISGFLFQEVLSEVNEKGQATRTPMLGRFSIG